MWLFHIGPDPPPRGAGGADLYILIFFLILDFEISVIPGVK